MGYLEEREKIKELTKDLADIIIRKHKEKEAADIDDIRNGINNYNEMRKTEITPNHILAYMVTLDDAERYKIMEFKAHYLKLERLLNNILLADFGKLYEKRRTQYGQ
jgi:hypothetical protein